MNTLYICNVCETVKIDVFPLFTPRRLCNWTNVRLCDHIVQ